jgi:DNA-binding transcriptional regulator YiaG
MSIRKPRQQLISPVELRALRKTTGLSIKNAAVALGIGYRTLEAYELGEVPAPKLVITMLQVLAAKRQAMITGRRKDMLDFLGQPFEVSL